MQSAVRPAGKPSLTSGGELRTRLRRKELGERQGAGRKWCRAPGWAGGDKGSQRKRGSEGTRGGGRLRVAEPGGVGIRRPLLHETPLTELCALPFKAYALGSKRTLPVHKALIITCSFHWSAIVFEAAFYFVLNSAQDQNCVPLCTSSRDLKPLRAGPGLFSHLQCSGTG